MSDTCTFDRRGNILGGTSLYKTPSQMGGDLRPVNRPRAKTYEAVTAWQRRELVDTSRVIAAGVSNISTALVQAGEFSVGDSWHIKSRSKDKAWGAARDEWFNKFFSRDCNARGRQADWRSTLRQLVWTRKVQGDYGIVFDGLPVTDAVTLKERAPTGRFQILKFDRISTGIMGSGMGAGAVSVGNGLEQCKELPKTQGYYSYSTSYGVWPGIYIINDKASRFDGQRIIDGVIVDANMITLGYRVTGFTADGRPTYVDIPKANLHFNFSTRQDTDLVRGIPELAEAVVPIMGLDDIQYLVTMAVKLASALAVTRESSDGNPMRAGRANFDETTTDAAGDTVTRKRAVEEIFPGIIELATNNKEALKALDFNRPTLNEENFIARVETGILHKFWPRSLIYAESTGRAGMRATGVQANTICAWDQVCLERDARWIGDRATEYGMRMGFIPVNDNLSDPYEYVFTVPGRFTVDEGNDSKMRLQSLGRCTISRGMICELDGYLAEEIEEQRYAEIDRTLAAAKKLAAVHTDFTVKEIALMFDSGEQNISFSDNAEVSNAEPSVGGDAQTSKTKPAKE